MHQLTFDFSNVLLQFSIAQNKQRFVGVWL